MLKISTISFFILLLSCTGNSETSFEKVSLGKSYRIISLNIPIESSNLKNSLLTIYEDSTYTLITPNGEYFENQSFDSENEITLQYSNKSITFTKIFPSENLTKLSSFSNNPFEMLIEDNYSLQFKETDLLSSGRNWWRLKPTGKETKKQIEQRLVAHLSYMIDYFQMQEDKQFKTFSMLYLNSPFKLYKNGISIPSKSKIPFSWNKLFYDNEDADYAYNTLSTALKSINYYPKDSESHIKGFSKAFKQMIDYIEN